MHRNRILFWSAAGAVIALGLGVYLWLAYRSRPSNLPRPANWEQSRKAQMAKADVPPEPWEPPDAWWKKVTLDAYDRANQGTMWPSARRAVVAFAKDLSEHPAATDDEADDALSAAETATDYGCTDALVLVIRGHYLQREAARAGNRNHPEARHLREAADALPGSSYHPFIKSLGLFWAAVTLGDMPPTPDPKSGKVPREVGIGYAEAGVALAAEAFADPELPAREASLLVEQAGVASVVLYETRGRLADQVLAALERSKLPRSAVLSARGNYLTSAAWDARGSGTAGTVTGAGWRGFAARLAEARAALEEAWKLDRTNAIAATGMITVCLGEGGERAEMELWFKRAMEADPGNFAACRSKLYYLDPRWHGTPKDMFGFGRELARAASDPRADPRSVRLPITLVDAHWTFARYHWGSHISEYPPPEYFANDFDAWDDVSGVYEKYLDKVPASRYHRTRYAVIAGWAGKWDVAAAQFDLLGENYSRRVIPEPALLALRAQAKAKAPGK